MKDVSNIKAEILKVLINSKAELTITEICRIINGMSASSCIRLRFSDKLLKGKYRKKTCEECKFKYSQVYQTIKTLEKHGIVTTRKAKLSDEYEPRGWDIYTLVKLNIRVHN